MPFCQLCFVCYLCTQKGCLGRGKLWNEQYWRCVRRVGCVGAGCNFVEGGGRGGERQKVEACVLLVWVGKLLPHLWHFRLIIDYGESIGIGNLYQYYCVTPHSLSRACSMFQVPGVPVQTKNNTNRIVMLLCCEKRRHISGTMRLVPI